MEAKTKPREVELKPGTVELLAKLLNPELTKVMIDAYCEGADLPSGWRLVLTGARLVYGEG